MRGRAEARRPSRGRNGEGWATVPTLPVRTEPPTSGTEVGSYFISNYPPYSFWKAEYLPAAEAALGSSPPAEVPLGLYLHIPFCRKRCKFCYFRVYTDKNADDVEVYLEALSREVALYAELPVMQRPFRFAYFGGGTPSFLSAQQLGRLVERLRRSVSWDEAEEVTFECEPGTLQKHKLQAIRDMGVTRLSLGIENFNDAVLEENGRAHLSKEVFRAYDWAREVGFPQVNVDLIAGMVGETDANWSDNVAKALALAPDSVTIYQMELPYNTVYSRGILGGGASPVAGWDDKRRWVREAFDRFLSAGYVVSSAYTLVKPSPTSGFVYRDSLWHGADMVGTGVASFSHVRGVHYQNVDGLDGYVESLRGGRLPLSRALPVEAGDLLIRELILQLKTGRVTVAYFRDKFGIDIAERFGAALRGLAAEGFVELGPEAIRVTREGLLRVDGLLPRFFRDEHRGARYT